VPALRQLTLEHEAAFNRIVRRAFLLPLGVMVVASLLLAWLVAHLLTVTNWVDHTDKVIAEAQSAERLMLDMESALRGYLINADPAQLDSFNNTSAQIDPALNALNLEVFDNSPQGEKIKAIRLSYENWFRYARDLIERRKQGGDYQSFSANAREMSLMNRVRDGFSEFLQVENALRAERSEAVQSIDRDIRRSRWIVLLALGIGIGFYLRTQLRQVARLYEEAAESLEQKTRALESSEASLREAQTKLRQHADDLEKTVAQRTAELRETVVQLESYSYSVSHDLRGPLRAIGGYAKVMIEDCGDQITPETKRYIDRILKACERMDNLIQDILSYSQITRAEMESSPVDLERLIKEIIEHYPDLRVLDGQIHLEKPLPTVLAPEALLSQCLSNLLNNAIKFTRDGVPVEVRVRAETHDKDLRIWIEDNGIGIEPKYHERIFDIFERIPGEDRYEGTGIGLAIVRKAAERMGGKAGVESQPGKGSRFWIDLPGRKV
jgi:signal transduction histidine kinase